MPNLFRNAIALVLSLLTAAAALAAAPTPDYKLAAGDSIKVQVYQSPDLTVEARVSEDGTISYPLVGSVHIGGMSIPQAEKTVAHALERGKFLKQPQVNIVLLQVRGNQVSVLGEVQRPGRFPLETMTVRVSDMLATAGGINPQGADQVLVSGTRNGKPFRKAIDVPSLFRPGGANEDVLLAPGDTLYVTKAPTFYIYGAAQRPGTYKIERGMTVQQALAVAGGPNARGSEHMRLDRKGPDGHVQQYDARMTDVVEPGDVLFVKESLF